MTIAIDLGRKATKQTNKYNIKAICLALMQMHAFTEERSFFVALYVFFCFVFVHALNILLHIAIKIMLHVNNTAFFLKMID